MVENPQPWIFDNFIDNCSGLERLRKNETKVQVVTKTTRRDVMRRKSQSETKQLVLDRNEIFGANESKQNKGAKMKNVTSIARHIELNRQRLEHALKSKNEDLIMRTQRLLTLLEASYFDATKDAVAPMPKKSREDEPHYLVFSEENQDGRVMSLTQYRALYKTMDHFDRQTHHKVEVDRSMLKEVQDVLTTEEESAKLNAG